jgi:hypothetical protein
VRFGKECATGCGGRLPGWRGVIFKRRHSNQNRRRVFRSIISCDDAPEQGASVSPWFIRYERWRLEKLRRTDTS